MIDLAQIEGFEWDEGNARKSLERHAVSQAEAEEVFLDPRVFLSDDERHSASEPRFHALAATLTGRLLQVSFTLRRGGTRIRVISARNMNRKERILYEEEET